MVTLRDELESYVDFRRLTILQANTTGQTIVLENFLNKLLDPTQQRIEILDNSPSSLAPVVAYSYEATNKFIICGFEPENSYTAVPTEAEAPSFGFNFVVLYPAGIDTARLKKIVNSYKQAGKSYTIEQI